MSREVHVRFCERGGVRFPSATHLVILVAGTREQAETEKAALGDYLRRSTKNRGDLAHRVFNECGGVFSL